MNRELIFKLSDALLDEKITVDSADWELLLGQIITNRVVGIAYKNLKKNNVKNKTHFTTGHSCRSGLQ